MAFVLDAALDAALNYLKANGTVLHICSAEPANYAGIAAVELASAPVTLTGPVNGDVSGRKVTIPSVTTDEVDVTGAATHWVLSNGSDTLVASNALDQTYQLDAAGQYSFVPTDIELPDFQSEA